ncbi:hypothetical protein F2Q70_00033195 [Brassica cretica]|uniref:Uncharacterized protein n=1 Tax=Brassica cretica TaxID=69181 RepID=A0A8S9FPX1_BRACR|nr:hypothetical protein F2Q70_00033195 [Brassica cretica]
MRQRQRLRNEQQLSSLTLPPPLTPKPATTKRTGLYSLVPFIFQIMFSSILFKKLPLETGVSVICLSPGVVLTNVARDLPRIFQALYAVIPYFIFSPQEGCRSSLFSATDPQIPEYWETLKTDDWSSPKIADLQILPKKHTTQKLHIECGKRH